MWKALQFVLWRVIWILAAGTLALGQLASDRPAPSLVEVYWLSSQTITVLGISNIVVLDDNITRTELGSDTIKFYGLERGETVAIGHANGKTISIRIRVIQRPQIEIPPTLGEAEMAHGSVSSAVQTSGASGFNSFGVMNGIFWSQLAGEKGQLSFSAQIEDSAYVGGHAFDPRTASLAYQDPTVSLRMIDFTVNLTNTETKRYMGPFGIMDTLVLRGANFSCIRGKTQHSIFAGTTLPSNYLTLGATRDLAGYSVQQQRTEKMSMFGNVSFVDAPTDVTAVVPGRRANLMFIGGVNYLYNARWAIEATSGISNHGGLARSTVSYVGVRTNFSASVSASNQLFPLNQLESLYTGTSQYKASWMNRTNSWLGGSLTYQHVTTAAAGTIISAGSSDYVSPGISIRPFRRQDLNLTYTYSRNNGGFSDTSSTGNRMDFYWNSRITKTLANSAQFSVGSIQDPLQINSEDEFSVQDTVSFPMRNGSLYFGGVYNRINPSLVEKLNGELNLLSPALQSLYLQDPASFVNSPNLPPDIKALLESQQPITLSFSASGQFQFASKLAITPSFSFARTTNGSVESWTPFVSYGLSYRIRPTLQLTSNMNTSWVFGSNNLAQRTSLISFGVTKNFTAAPIMAMGGPQRRIIEGRVYRDDNINGVYDAGEPGLADVRVKLDNGQTSVTDKNGMFRFVGVSAAVHWVSIDLAQFSQPVRLTRANQQQADVIRERTASVNFGIVNFARVMGDVFNDLRFANTLQPDSKGIANVRLLLKGSQEKRTIVSEGTGEFEVDDILPGDYQLSVDHSTLPANFIAPSESVLVHVNPVSTMVENIPLRALRSISGTVMLKVPNPSDGKTGGEGQQKEGFTLVPMPNVQISAGYGVVKTDANGVFLLRNLPAGDLTVSIIPLQSLPEGMKAPSGQVHMPNEPIEVKGATIVISNPDLVPYLTGLSVSQLRLPHTSAAR